MYQYCFYLDWTGLPPEVWAAWVQAVGSIIAIGVAIFVPSRIASKDRARAETFRRFRAATYAFVLLPQLRTMEGRLATAKARWREVPSRYDDDDVAEYLNVPEGLSERLLDIHELAEAGIAIQEAVDAINQLRLAVFYQYAHWRYAGVFVDHDTGDEGVMSEPEDVSAMFTHAATTARAAVEALEQARRAASTTQ
ncbi:hypothetical protein [Novilysobacter erysipheiresistens]|uniref:DUF4760 domain-containing protein n=1 Tax=Novilysobacter erysipheiresistens TaxID=1749332 RepID=A0ABU7YW81_9GAMM